MGTRTVLALAAESAVCAAGDLEKGTKPSALTKRLSVADHLAVLEGLESAVVGAFGDGGLLQQAARRAGDEVAGAGPKRGRRISEICGLMIDARREGQVGEITAARDMMRGDVQRLRQARRRAGEAVSGRNTVARHAHAAAEAIWRLAQAMPSEGPMDELEAGLDAAVHVLGHLKGACLHEAKLIDAAYEGAGSGRSAGGPRTVVFVAGRAMGAAQEGVRVAHRIARHLAREASHVLHWLPPYVHEAGGLWDLQTRDAYDAGEPQEDPAWSLAAPRNASVGALTQWVTRRLGYPVTLSKSSTLIRPVGSVRPYRLEPLYYVRRSW